MPGTKRKTIDGLTEADIYVKRQELESLDFNGNYLPLTTTIEDLAYTAGAGNSAIAIGNQAGDGKVKQQSETVAIGTFAGRSAQNQYAIAVGYSAGFDNQQAAAVAIGFGAGSQTQGIDSVAIGTTAGATSLGARSVAIGKEAGVSFSGADSVVVGYQSGASADESVAIGRGASAAGATSVAIGRYAKTSGVSAVSIGNIAGQTSQGLRCIAVGAEAGNTLQGNNAVAVGFSAGTSEQGTDSIAIGYRAGESKLGASSIAIGREAKAQANNAIVLNASGSETSATVAGSTLVRPVRLGTSSATVADERILQYGKNSYEVTYSKCRLPEVPEGKVYTLASWKTEDAEAGFIGTGIATIGGGGTITAKPLEEVVQGSFLGTPVTNTISVGGITPNSNTIVLNASGSTLTALDPGTYIKPITSSVQYPSSYAMQYDTSSGELYASEDFRAKTAVFGTSGSVTLPVWSSNTTYNTQGTDPGWTISASSELTALRFFWRAFDQNPATYWSCASHRYEGGFVNGDTATTSNVDGGSALQGEHITISYSRAKMSLSGFTIVVIPDLLFQLKQFSVLGSNDNGSSWTTLFSQSTDLTWTIGESKSFVPTVTAGLYNSFRLVIRKCEGGECSVASFIPSFAANAATMSISSTKFGRLGAELTLPSAMPAATSSLVSATSAGVLQYGDQAIAHDLGFAGVAAYRVKNIAAPLVGTDATNKTYVDSHSHTSPLTIGTSSIASTGTVALSLPSALPASTSLTSLTSAGQLSASALKVPASLPGSTLLVTLDSSGQLATGAASSLSLSGAGGTSTLSAAASGSSALKLPTALPGSTSIVTLDSGGQLATGAASSLSLSGAGGTSTLSAPDTGSSAIKTFSGLPSVVSLVTVDGSGSLAHAQPVGHSLAFTNSPSGSRMPNGMTSASWTSGSQTFVVSASGSFGTSVPYKAFDGNGTGTFWCTPLSVYNTSTGAYTSNKFKTVGGSNVNGEWIQLDFGAEVRLTAYYITTSLTRSPRKWVMAVSDDGNTWTTWHAQTTNYNFADATETAFVTTPVICRYAVLIVTENSGIENYFQIGALSFDYSGLALRVKNLALPANGTDGANKSYVDSHTHTSPLTIGTSTIASPGTVALSLPSALPAATSLVSMTSAGVLQHGDQTIAHNLSFGGTAQYTVKNIAAPTLLTDAVNKDYADSLEYTGLPFVRTWLIGVATYSMSANVTQMNSLFSTLLATTPTSTSFSNDFQNVGAGEHYMMQVDGFMYIPVSTNIRFRTRSDDISDWFIDGKSVASMYNGENGGNGTQTLQAFTAGWKSFRVRFHEYTGNQYVVLDWDLAGGTNYTTIPSNYWKGVRNPLTIGNTTITSAGAVALTLPSALPTATSLMSLSSTGTLAASSVKPPAGLPSAGTDRVLQINDLGELELGTWDRGHWLTSDAVVSVNSGSFRKAPVDGAVRLAPVYGNITVSHANGFTTWQNTSGMPRKWLITGSFKFLTSAAATNNPPTSGAYYEIWVERNTVRPASSAGAQGAEFNFTAGASAHGLYGSGRYTAISLSGIMNVAANEYIWFESYGDTQGAVTWSLVIGGTGPSDRGRVTITEIPG